MDDLVWPHVPSGAVSRDNADRHQRRPHHIKT